MRLSLNEANARLENRSNGKFTSGLILTKDKNSARVRFLLDKLEDSPFYCVHTVKLMTKTGKAFPVDVSCIADEGECPLCKEALLHQSEQFPITSVARDNVYIPLLRLYNYEGKYEPEINIWKRSSVFYRDTLAPFAARYNLGNKVVEISRAGVAPRVTYSLYPLDNDVDGTPYKDLPSVEQLKQDYEYSDSLICGEPTSFIREWTADQMRQFIETGVYPTATNKSSGSEESQAPEPRSRTVAREDYPF